MSKRGRMGKKTWGISLTVSLSCRYSPRAHLPIRRFLLQKIHALVPNLGFQAARSLIPEMLKEKGEFLHWFSSFLRSYLPL